MPRSFAATRPLLPACLLALSAACADSDGGADPSGAAVSDSAGVAQVHLSAQVVENAPTVTLEEVVRIGTLDGPQEEQFFRLVDAFERDGEIYALDGGDHEVRVFDLSGAFLRGFGREGDGPGEFRNPRSVYAVGDTIVVSGRRLDLVDTEGRSLATGPGMVFGEEGILTRTFPTAQGWRGNFQTSRARGMERGVPFRETISIVEMDPLSGERTRDVFTYEGPEILLDGEIGFYLTPYFQASPSAWATENGLIYYTPGDEYRIDVIDGGTGDLVRRITSDVSIAPVTDELLQRAIDLERARVADAPPGSEGEMFAKVIDKKVDLPVPPTLPVFGQFHASPSGWLLALRRDLDVDPVETGDPSSWDLFRPDGTLAGRVELAAGTSVLEVMDDALLVSERDEFDVQSLVKFRMIIPD